MIVSRAGVEPAGGVLPGEPTVTEPGPIAWAVNPLRVHRPGQNEARPA